VIGGSGKQVTLPLAARYADEWNIAFRTPEQFKGLSAYLDSLLDQSGRPRSAVRRTLMHRFDYSSTDRVREQIATYAAVGAQRVMLQWADLDNLSGISDLGRALC
jgi:alkanesulfonate monooxygenase SsuD/methylene tetrahydromethanopterin reductase-like flavin-dependent oxidoreductase (luciferase family)